MCSRIPYYGVNTEEINKYNRFVTFSHLPQEALIRIYNLAGVQVQGDPQEFRFAVRAVGPCE